MSGRTRWTGPRCRIGFLVAEIARFSRSKFDSECVRKTESLDLPVFLCFASPTLPTNCQSARWRERGEGERGWVRIAAVARSEAASQMRRIRKKQMAADLSSNPIGRPNSSCTLHSRRLLSAGKFYQLQLTFANYLCILVDSNFAMQLTYWFCKGQNVFNVQYVYCVGVCW